MPTAMPSEQAPVLGGVGEFTIAFMRDLVKTQTREDL
jgi:5,10-methylene-tetrahydrofolate dehydrogenase/methenyl tetrahydrofolate cyclohydrolase